MPSTGTEQIQGELVAQYILKKLMRVIFKSVVLTKGNAVVC